MARVVMACALLKHHTRRGERDPGALAGGLAARHPRSAYAMRALRSRPTPKPGTDLSVEQAYDRLPEPRDDEVR